MPEQELAERLPQEFFDRPATEVAPDLLGCVLWHDSPAGLVGARLVEVEAYRGPIDAASHAFRGPTPRNAVMFGPPGHIYVYFSYGMHYCANLVCQPDGRGEAVLLRAAAIVAGADLAWRRRYGVPDAACDSAGSSGGTTAGSGLSAAAGGRSAAGSSGSGAGSGANARRGGSAAPSAGNGKNSRQRELDLARGPGRLCQALGIDRSLDGADVCAPGGPLGIGPPDVSDQPAEAAARTILTGPRVGISKAIDFPWRYWLAGDGHVSGYRTAKPRAPRPKPVSGGDDEDGTMQT